MTVPHYGKREAGSLTASAPGDTLYFPFASYNDSGDSEALTGLAVTDIEVFKNGQPATRTTDSGYSLISDTGMVGDRVGLYRCSIQLFNTADDTGHYESGAWYQAAIDAVTIDAKTVRLWLGSWEIGRQKVNAVEVDSDTGAANVLKQFAGTAGTLSPTGELDTGSVANGSAIAADAKRIAGDTGAANWLKTTYAAGFADTGLYSRIDKLAEDTGGVNINSIQGDTGAAGWLKAAYLNGFNDTGVINRFDRLQFEVDTGLRAHMDDSDTGIKDAIADLDTGLRDFITDAKNELDTGGVNVTAVVDTGVVNQAVWGANASRTITSFDVDTGLRDLIADVKVELDTGLRDFITDAKNELDTGGVNVTAAVDTGVVNQAVWQGNATRVLTANTNLSGLQVNVTQLVSDTGAANWLKTTYAAGFADTGLYSRFDKLAEDTGGVNINSIQGDTGAAGWLKATFLNGFADTGLNDRLARIGFDADTGLRDHINDLDTGLRDHIDNTDTGLRARLNTLAEDTGGVNINAIAGDTGAASWLKAAFLNGFADTGLYSRIDKLAEDTGGVNVTSFADTGINDRLARILSDTDTGIQSSVNVTSSSDTGLNDRLASVKTKTDSLTFTVAGQVDANIQSVNDTTVTGTGSSGSEWGP